MLTQKSPKRTVNLNPKRILTLRHVLLISENLCHKPPSKMGEGAYFSNSQFPTKDKAHKQENTDIQKNKYISRNHS